MVFEHFRRSLFILRPASGNRAFWNTEAIPRPPARIARNTAEEWRLWAKRTLTPARTSRCDRRRVEFDPKQRLPRPWRGTNSFALFRLYQLDNFLPYSKMESPSQETYFLRETNPSCVPPYMRSACAPNDIQRQVRPGSSRRAAGSGRRRHTFLPAHLGRKRRCGVGRRHPSPPRSS